MQKKIEVTQEVKGWSCLLCKAEQDLFKIRINALEVTLCRGHAYILGNEILHTLIFPEG
jgi:hypothetical protein